MTYNPDIHHRRSIRLKEYDYSQAGAYFITLGTHNHICLFGDIVDTQMTLNEAGRILHSLWEELPLQYPGVEIDEFVIMPNHIHGIILLDICSDEENYRRKIEMAPRPLGEIVRGFKARVTVTLNRFRKSPRTKIWQRNYYEHIIRDYKTLNVIREYIINNPQQWALDRENPEATLSEKKKTSTNSKDEAWQV